MFATKRIENGFRDFFDHLHVGFNSFHKFSALCSRFLSPGDCFNLIQVDKRTYRSILFGPVIKESPFAEAKALASFQTSLLNMEISNRYTFWLRIERELQSFREQHILAPLKEQRLRTVFKEWFASPTCLCGFDPYPWPASFNQRNMLSLLGDLRILLSESSHWECPSNGYQSNYNYSCYFCIGRQFVYFCDAVFYYEDIFNNLVADIVHERRLSMQEFGLYFFEINDFEFCQLQKNGNYFGTLSGKQSNVLLYFDYLLDSDARKILM